MAGQDLVAMTVFKDPERLEPRTGRTSTGNTHYRFPLVKVELGGGRTADVCVLLHFVGSLFESKVGIRRNELKFEERAKNLALNTLLHLQDQIKKFAELGMDPVELTVEPEDLYQVGGYESRYRIGERVATGKVASDVPEGGGMPYKPIAGLPLSEWVEPAETDEPEEA